MPTLPTDTTAAAADAETPAPTAPAPPPPDLPVTLYLADTRQQHGPMILLRTTREHVPFAWSHLRRRHEYHTTLRQLLAISPLLHGPARPRHYCVLVDTSPAILRLETLVTRAAVAAAAPAPVAPAASAPEGEAPAARAQGGEPPAARARGAPVFTPKRAAAAAA